MLRFCVSARVVLRKASASAPADSARSRFRAISSSADFRAEISWAVPTRRRTNPGRIADGESPHPPSCAVRFSNAELLVELAGLNRFGQPRKNADAVLWMYNLFVGFGIFPE